MEEWLPEDVICEILCRLPIKTMIGFKCVCKTWNCLISEVCVPRISRRMPLSGFLFPAKRRTKFIVDFAENGGGDGDGFVESYCRLLPSDDYPYYVLDCCNGLVLLVSKSVPRYLVCNPATKQFISLPKASADLRVYHAALAFNPCESSHYKVVRFIYSCYFSVSDSPALEIFSSETGKWIRHELVVEPPVAFGVDWIRRTVYLDGILYKLIVSKHLLCFDLKTLAVQAIELPRKDETDEYGSISLSKGALFYANHYGTRLLVWQFDYSGKSGCFWMLKDSINVYDLLANNPACCSLHVLRNSFNFKVYAMHPTSDIIYLGIPYLILSYQVGSGKLKPYYAINCPEELCLSRFLYPYTRCYTMLNDVT